MGQAKRKRDAGAATEKRAEPDGAGRGKDTPAPPVTPPWDPDGALTHADIGNLHGLIGQVACSGAGLDLVGRLRSKLAKHSGFAAVFVPVDIARVVGVEVLQEAMAGEAEAQVIAGGAVGADPAPATKKKPGPKPKG